VSDSSLLPKYGRLLSLCGFWWDVFWGCRER
jgi:hypothetical protein